MIGDVELGAVANFSGFIIALEIVVKLRNFSWVEDYQ
jgi:hypothetical protein